MNHRLADIFVPKKVWALSVWCREDGEFWIKGALIERNKRSIRIIDENTEYVQLEKWKENNDFNLPGLVLAWGKGVLYRTVDLGLTADQALSRSVPGVDVTHFHRELSTFGTQALLAFCRNELIEDLRQELGKAGFSLFHFSLGPEVIGNNEALQEVKELAVGQIKLTNRSTEGIEIDQVTTDACGRIAYSDLEVYKDLEIPLWGTLSFMSGNHINNKWEDLVYKNATKQVGIVGVLALFVLLLGNLFLFQHLQGDVQQLQTEHAVHQNLYASIDTLQTDIAQKRELLRQTGGIASYDLIKVLDQIGRSVPRSVVLNKLDQAAPGSRVEFNKAIRFQLNKIHIEGQSSDEKELTEWLAELVELEEIEAVNIVGFDRSNKKGQFEIELVLI